MDKKIRDFSKGLIEFVNSYEIPMEIKRIILADVYAKVEEKANQAIAEESIQEEKDE